MSPQRALIITLVPLAVPALSGGLLYLALTNRWWQVEKVGPLHSAFISLATLAICGAVLGLAEHGADHFLALVSAAVVLYGFIAIPISLVVGWVGKRVVMRSNSNSGRPPVAAAE
jgi:hypothetical protein